MCEYVNGYSQLPESSAETIQAFCTIVDELCPSLTPAEQIVYLRLFRLSHARQSPFAKCRYEELAVQCNISIRTLQRALQGLRQKQLVSTAWHSHGATTFTVRLLSQFSHRPAFLPRRRRDFVLPPPSMRAPVYDAFSPDDRALFLDCKRRLSPAKLNELTEAAVEWLTGRTNGDPEAFSDELLRDKVDELVFDEVFGPERRRPYAPLFAHLHRLEPQTSP
jgi:hypothetical protein